MTMLRLTLTLLTTTLAFALVMSWVMGSVAA